MTEVINIKRLGWLMSKHWFENRKLYSLFILSIMLFLAGWFTFLLLVGNPFFFDQSTQLVVYFLGLFVSGCLSAAFLLRDFSNKAKKINYLLLPAAALEKLVCTLFYGVLLFFVIYTSIFYITDFLAIKMANNTVSNLMNSNSANAMEWRQQFGITQPLRPSTPVNIFNPGPGSFMLAPGDNVQFFTAFFPIQSVFILGSVYFKKNSLFKTIVALLVIVLLFFILEGKILSPLFPRTSQIFNAFTTLRVFDAAGNSQVYSLPFWLGEVATFLLTYAITPLLWIATYYRLKENEI